MVFYQRNSRMTMKGPLKFLLLVTLVVIVGSHDAVKSEDFVDKYEVDPKGYLIFCLCMGRFGNQAEHFLGGLAFAKAVDRTLLLPPWRTYKNVRFTDWFRLESITEYHRVIVAEDFMENLADQVWPVGNRTGCCFSYTVDRTCDLKQGNPFGPFWDGLGVDFDKTENFMVSYSQPEEWKQRFPPSKYPVVALKGAPAPFPMRPENWELHKYLQWSDDIIQQGQKYIHDHFPGQEYIGIHLRNGADWENACKHAPDQPKYMASPQCIPLNSGGKVTSEMCLPSTQEVLRLLEKVVKETDVKVIYVATDKNPMIAEIEQHLKDYQVSVFHQDPWLPQLDLYILGQSVHFIGNCVSSFTSFVTRERAVSNKPTSFWGYS
ncbi:GDP-fucose protein O-fucosyltransferase 1-like isoform X1 [Mercenaria mercenaria]|uniref:GDP-fucose protein O-fucosyltransferase 1-like isoform X1 n=1 Tax=Mercenaria mercenaria TaxID=6596 RepID=UPI00234EDDA8|nr:GDP-fucose protein O-fucosyltransferase 1-like isoform X1 [Mercenaria mercenaria]